MKKFPGFRRIAQLAMATLISLLISTQTALAAPSTDTQFIADAKKLFQEVMNDIYILLIPAAAITFLVIFLLMHFAPDDQTAHKRQAWMRRAAIGLVFAYAASALVNIVGSIFI